MASFTLPAGFAIQSVDHLDNKGHSATTHRQKSVANPNDSSTKPTGPTVSPPPVPPPTDELAIHPDSELGVLSNFTGTYTGFGFNTIFRPKTGPQNPQDKIFDPPVKIVKSDKDDNVLQINLTTEQLIFTPSLGPIPNRGLGDQPDVTLHGVGYTQTVQDVTFGESKPIHFEPGLWVLVPETKVPKRRASLVRMASIPHGTTINAQSTAQPVLLHSQPDGKFLIPEYEKFFPLGTSPSLIGGTKDDIKDEFDSLTGNFDNIAVSRIPQDLTQFKLDGTITKQIFDNPHQIFNDINNSDLNRRRVLRSIVFTVSTDPTHPAKPHGAQLGGGTANIDFLVGDGPTPDSDSTNARAASMTSIFWISTVQIDIEVPAMKAADEPLLLPVTDPKSRIPIPIFKISPPRDLTEPKTITVEYVQIQYSQTVILNFGGDLWPHVSVATLVPYVENGLDVPSSVWDE